MQDRWYRIHELYEPLKDSPHAPRAYPRVCFYNDHPKAIIKKLALEWMVYHQELFIEITAKEHYKDYYNTVYRECFKEKEPGEGFYLRSICDVTQIKNLFAAINKKERVCSEKLENEIENVFFFTQKLNWVMHADVDAMLMKLEEMDCNIRLADSTPRVTLDLDNLFHLAKKYKGHYPEAKHIIPFFNHYDKKPEFDFEMFFEEEEDNDPRLKKNNDLKCTQIALRLFAEGKNPNSYVSSRGFRNQTILMLAVDARRPLLFQAAVVYGAIPDLTGDFEIFESPLERLFCMKPYRLEQNFVNVAFDTLNSACTILTSPISPVAQEESGVTKRPSILFIDMDLIFGCIYTELTFSDKKTISTRFQKAEDMLPKNESMGKSLFDLYQLWQQFFDMPSPYETFKSLFVKNIFVERAFVGSTLIGFNFFELCKTKNSDHIIYHLMYTGILSGYRGYGLSPFLMYRPVLALQKLYPSKRISVYFEVISVDGFMTAKNFTGLYPMFYTEITHQEMRMTILPGVFKKEEKLYADDKTIKCYIEDDTAVREEKLTSGRFNPYKSLVEECFMDLKSGQKKDRAVPIHFYLTSSNQEKLENSVSKGLKIDYKNHIAHFSRFFSPLAKQDFDEIVPFVSQRSGL